MNWDNGPLVWLEREEDEAAAGMQGQENEDSGG